MLDFLLGLLNNLIWALLAAAATWLWAWRKIRLLRKQLQTLAPARAEREVVLIASGRDNIAEAVQAHLTREGLASMPVFHIREGGEFSDKEEDWMAYVHKAREEIKKLRELGVSRIHFFTNVPVVMGVFLGGLLDNGPEVYVYHYFNGVYRRIGRMTRETVYY